MMQLRGGVGGGENKDSVNGRLSAECDVALPRRSTTNGTQVPVYIRPFFPLQDFQFHTCAMRGIAKLNFCYC